LEDIKNTIWKLNEGVNREFQITFLTGGFFEYSKDGKKIGGLDSKWTWKLDGKSITLSFNDGFQINSGEINSDFNNIQGTFKSEWGDKGEWSAVYEKEAELNLNKSVSNNEIGTHGHKTLTLSILDILKKLFGENVINEDTPEPGTLAHKIRDREYKITVNGDYADEIIEDYMYEGEEEVEVRIRTENYLGHYFREDFFCHFELDELSETLPATFSVDEIEKWINKSIKNAVDSMNLYIIADLEDDEEVYLEIPEPDPIKLIDLNEEWIGESFILEGNNPYEDAGRLYQLKNPFE